MSWKDYLDGRLIKQCNDFFVIKPKESSREIVPLACPVCECLFRTSDDERSFRDFSCCEDCETNWARPNQEKWKEGWRPEKELVLAKLKEKKIDIHLEF